MAESSVPSRADDFIDIYVAPAAVFERRTDGKFGLALLVLFVGMTALFFASRSAMAPIFDAEFTRAMAANPNLTPEQVEAGKKVAGTFGSIFAIAVVPIMALLLGVGVWIGATRRGRPAELCAVGHDRHIRLVPEARGVGGRGRAGTAHGRSKPEFPVQCEPRDRPLSRPGHHQRNAPRPARPYRRVHPLDHGTRRDRIEDHGADIDRGCRLGRGSGVAPGFHPDDAAGHAGMIRSGIRGIRGSGDPLIP